MKWYDKQISPKTSNIILCISFSLLAIVFFVQSWSVRKKLSACSVYTVGKITRVYSVRGQVRATYFYRVNAKTVQATDDGVSNFDTGESWTVDMNKLSKRRLLLQVYCDDISVHRILWKVSIPDTLQFVPTQGWKELPFVKSD